MNDTQQRLKSEHRCPKCDAPDTYVRYIRRSDVLDCACRRCRYSWRENPTDRREDT